jgi:hypothetical protein
MMMRKTVEKKNEKLLGTFMPNNIRQAPYLRGCLTIQNLNKKKPE